MADPKIEPSRGSHGSVPLEREKGATSVRKTLIICATVLFCFVAADIGVAIVMDTKHERDYVSVLTPILSAAISGGLAFFAGTKVRKD